MFSVDVEDGKPPLKLPYNRGDDPYEAARTFLTRNSLPGGYLEQVSEIFQINFFNVRISFSMFSLKKMYFSSVYSNFR